MWDIVRTDMGKQFLTKNSYILIQKKKRQLKQRFQISMSVI
jgi:hypothetical protein